MKYKVDVTLEGYLEIEEDTKEEAIAHTEDGFSIEQFNCEDIEVGEVTEIR